mgnify:CR=1 FL=1
MSRPTRIRTFLQRHRANVERAAATIEQSAPAALAGFVVIPILAIFFLSDGENLANQVIHLVSAKENHAAVRSLADELHVMLQHYIRRKSNPWRTLASHIVLSRCSSWVFRTRSCSAFLPEYWNSFRWRADDRGGNHCHGGSSHSLTLDMDACRCSLFGEF